MQLPKRLLPYVENEAYRTDEIGRSGSQVLILPGKVLKIERKCAESDNEHAMYAWLRGKLSVPRVFESFSEDGYNYLLMERAAGEMACGEGMMRDPQHAVSMLAKGLRALWSVDITDCPADQRLSSKLPRAKARLEAGLIDEGDTEPDTLTRFGSMQALYRYLDERRPEEDLVFSHGDYCLPNVFFDRGVVSAFIDLGRSGVADRWQDIALCVRSLAHNFGTDRYREMLLAELNLPCDAERIDYYILLDEFF